MPHGCCVRGRGTKLVDVLDRVDQYEDFDPAEHYQLRLDESQLEAEELAVFRSEAEDAGQTRGNRKPRRLDG